MSSNRIILNGANENLRKVKIKPVPSAGLSDDWGVPEGVPGSVGCAVVSSLARLDFRPSLPSPGLAAAWWATGLVCTLYLYTSLSFIFRSVVYAEMEEVRFVVTIIVARSSRPAADFHLSTQSVRR